MEYKIAVLDEAIQEVQEAMDWYGEIIPDLSIDLEARFYTSLNAISKHPFTSQKIKFSFRKYNVSRFPYNIIFKIKDTQITIVAFAHHKRKPNYWKKRK